MASVKSPGKDAVVTTLCALGFAPREAARLMALRQRFERGELSEVLIEQKRLDFARWLVQSGRLSDD